MKVYVNKESILKVGCFDDEDARHIIQRIRSGNKPTWKEVDEAYHREDKQITIWEGETGWICSVDSVDIDKDCIIVSYQTSIS